MRKRFTMTQKQLEGILNACKPVPCMMIGDYVPRSPQENANAAWQSLAREMGFEWDSVRPVAGEPQTVFEAEEIAASADCEMLKQAGGCYGQGGAE